LRTLSAAISAVAPAPPAPRGRRTGRRRKHRAHPFGEGRDVPGPSGRGVQRLPVEDGEEERPGEDDEGRDAREPPRLQAGRQRWDAVVVTAIRNPVWPRDVSGVALVRADVRYLLQ